MTEPREWERKKTANANKIRTGKLYMRLILSTFKTALRTHKQHTHNNFYAIEFFSFSLSTITVAFKQPEHNHFSPFSRTFCFPLFGLDLISSFCLFFLSINIFIYFIRNHWICYFFSLSLIAFRFSFIKHFIVMYISLESTTLLKCLRFFFFSLLTSFVSFLPSLRLLRRSNHRSHCKMQENGNKPNSNAANAVRIQCHNVSSLCSKSISVDVAVVVL